MEEAQQRKAQSQAAQGQTAQGQTTQIKLSRFDFTGQDLKTILKIVIALSSIYLVLVTVPITSLIVIAVIFMCIKLLVKIKLSQIKLKGPNNFSPILRQILFEKSFFDIFSDLIYFPIISQIILAFIRPIITKPSPDQLKNSFQHIHPKAKEIISTKGLINIFPQQIRSICRKQGEPISPVVRQWTWINSEKYKSHKQIHEETFQKRIIEKIDEKFDWKILTGMAFLVACGFKSLNAHKMKKLLIQNGALTGFILVVIIGLIKLSQKKKHNQTVKLFQTEAKVGQQSDDEK